MDISDVQLFLQKYCPYGAERAETIFLFAEKRYGTPPDSPPTTCPHPPDYSTSFHDLALCAAVVGVNAMQATLKMYGKILLYFYYSLPKLEFFMRFGNE